jgi:autotransporter translocation and assembly factor TamB
MRRHLRFWINSLLLLVPLILLSVGAYRLVRGMFGYLNSDARLAGTMSAEATRALKREVRIGDVKITGNLWGLDASNIIDLRDVSVAEKPGFKGHRFAHADRVTIWYNLRQLIASQDSRAPLVNEVRLVAPDLSLVRDVRGEWNFTELLKPQAVTGRPLTDKLSFVNGILYYSDAVFPHPADVPGLPLYTRVDHLSGVVLIRPDKSVAFDVAGSGEPRILRDFHAIGILNPDPLRVQAQVAARGFSLPFAGRRFLSSGAARITSGSADLSVSGLYAPSSHVKWPLLDLSGLDAFGDVQVFRVDASSPILGAPISNVNGTATLTTDSVLGNVSGSYAGATISLSGSVLQLLKKTTTAQGVTHTVFNIRSSGADPEPATLALKGSIRNGDLGQALRLLKLDRRLASLPPDVRASLRQAKARGQADFEVAGALDDPTATLTAHLDTLQYDDLRGDRVDIRALYAQRTVTADIRGRYADGDAVIRAQVATGKIGNFQVEAHGKNLDLTRLGFTLDPPLQGRGQLDLSMRGQRGRTPFISAQVQLSDLNYNKQTFRSVYARAETVGRDLVLRTVRAEDPKGFALASGKIHLPTQTLDIDVAADDIDLNALTKAVKLPAVQTQPAKTVQGEPNTLALQGIGYLRGKITGTFGRPEVSGRVTGLALQVGEDKTRRILADRVETDFHLNRDALSIRNGSLQHYPGQIRFTGDVKSPFAAAPTLHFVVRTDDKNLPDIADLLNLANVDTRGFLVTGNLSTGDIVLDGTPQSLRISTPFTVRLQDASINGISVRNAVAQMAYRENTLQLLSFSAQMARGTLTASGEVTREGVLNIDLRGANLSLERLAQIAPADTLPMTVTGTLDSFQAHVAGTTKAPVATLNLTASGVAVNTMGVGDIQGAARYADKRVVMQELTISNAHDPVLKGGKIVVSSLAYNTENRALQGQAQIVAVPIEWLRQQFQNSTAAAGPSGEQALDMLERISGPISGTVTLDGTSEAPRADVALNTENIRIDNYLITELKAQASVTKEGVTNGRARLAFRPDTPTGAQPAGPADTQEAVIDARKFDIAFKGNIDADVNAYHVDLGILRNILSIAQDMPLAAVSLPVTGMADTIGIIAHGSAKSPDIDVSLNLRNVGYRVPQAVAAADSTLQEAAATEKAAAKKPAGQATGANTGTTSVSEVTIDRVDIAQIQLRGPRTANGVVVEEGRIEAADIQIAKDERIGGDIRHYVARASGTILGFQWESPFVPRSARLNIQASIVPQDDNDQNLRILSVFAPGLLDPTTQGQISVTANVGGTLGDPTVRGGMTLTAPTLKLQDYATGLRNVKADFALQDDRLTVQSFTAQSQVFGRSSATPSPAIDRRSSVTPSQINKTTGSDITLTGSIPLGFGLKSVQGANGLSLQAGRFVFDEAPLPGAKTGRVQGEASIDLQLAGSVKAPFVTGRVHVNNTTTTLPREFAESQGGVLRLPIRPSFDLTVSLDRNVRLRNPQLDANIDGYIHLVGRVVAANGESDAEPGAQQRLDAHLDGLLTLKSGTLTLPTARFKILPPGGTISLLYPVYQDGQPVMNVNINSLKAQTSITATSLGGVRKRYQVTVTANGPLLGETQSRFTNRSGMSLAFETVPNDLAIGQQALTERLAGALIGVDALSQFGQNPGQAFASALTNVFTSSVLPGGFDRLAANLGFEELAINYDPVQRLTLTVSRQLFGPLYVTYIRSLDAVHEMYDLKFSLRFKDRYQVSYDIDEQHTHRLLLEGVWRF